MRVLVFGNSGSGKSTYARALAAKHGIAYLELDAIVWKPGTVGEAWPMADILVSLRAFIDAHQAWVIEGCYGEIIEAAVPAATELVFLNPGLEACLANNRRRPWEPHKYASAAEQDAVYDLLQEWVAAYYTRQDRWSYAAHRRIFDAHPGAKQEYHGPPPAP